MDVANAGVGRDESGPDMRVRQGSDWAGAEPGGLPGTTAYAPSGLLGLLPKRVDTLWGRNRLLPSVMTYPGTAGLW